MCRTGFRRQQEHTQDAPAGQQQRGGEVLQDGGFPDTGKQERSAGAQGTTDGPLSPCSEASLEPR